MLLEHFGARPTVPRSAYVAPNAVLCGDVVLGEGCRVLFGAVLTAEGGSVRIGDRCIVMEHALIRGREGHPSKIGNNVLIGPSAHVNGATIEDGAFLATGACAFPGSVIGAGAEVRIHGVVHVNSELPENSTVPIGWIAAGAPAELFPPERHQELWEVQVALDFPGTVFRLSRDEATMERVTQRYVEVFGRHRSDRLLEQ